MWCITLKTENTNTLQDTKRQINQSIQDAVLKVTIKSVCVCVCVCRYICLSACLSFCLGGMYICRYSGRYDCMYVCLSLCLLPAISQKPVKRWLWVSNLTRCLQCLCYENASRGHWTLTFIQGHTELTRKNNKCSPWHSFKVTTVSQTWQIFNVYYNSNISDNI